MSGHVDETMLKTFQAALEGADKQYLSTFLNVLTVRIGSMRLYQKTGEDRFAEAALRTDNFIDELLSCYQVDAEG